MAIASPDDLINALANSARPRFWTARSVLNQSVAGYTDLWLYQELPTLMSTTTDRPTTTVVYPTKATKGALINFTNPTPPAKTYLGGASLNCATSGHTLLLVDRLAHMGGLSGSITTQQTVGIDIRDTNVPAARKGATDYSDIYWGIEIYADIGTTRRDLQVNYRNGAGTDGQTQTFGSADFVLGGSSPVNRAGRFFPVSFAGGCSQINHCTIQTGTTGATGDWGWAAFRVIAQFAGSTAGVGIAFDWTKTLLPEIPDDACLQWLLFSGNATTNVIYGSATLISG